MYRLREGKVRPSIRFDGLDDCSQRQVNQKAETWAALLVAPFSPCKGAIRSANPAGGADYDPGFTVDLFQLALAFDQISVEGAGRNGGQKDQMTSSFAAGGFHVVTVVRGPEQIDLYIDGSSEASRPVTPALTIMDELRIGARFYSGTERIYFHGDMAQLLLYGRALDQQDRKTIEETLKVSETELQEGVLRVAEEWKERQRNRMVAPSTVRSWPNAAAFVAESGGIDPATWPIRTDVREAIELGVRHLNNLYDRDKDDEPYFFVNREADGTGKMRHSVNIGIPHVRGALPPGLHVRRTGCRRSLSGRRPGDTRVLPAHLVRQPRPSELLQ